MILWTDLETTGLNFDLDLILETGFILTTKNLEEVWRYHALVSFPAAVDLEHAKSICDSFVRDMHTKSGLWEDLGKGRGKSFIQIESEVLDAVRSCNPLLCGGRSVHFDRNFLRINMPTLNKRLHHRNVDVSSLYSVFEAWTGKLPEKVEGAHRVMQDLEDTIREARFYKDFLQRT